MVDVDAGTPTSISTAGRLLRVKAASVTLEVEELQAGALPDSLLVI